MREYCEYLAGASGRQVVKENGVRLPSRRLDCDALLLPFVISFYSVGS